MCIFDFRMRILVNTINIRLLICSFFRYLLVIALPWASVLCLRVFVNMTGVFLEWNKKGEDSFHILYVSPVVRSLLWNC